MAPKDDKQEYAKQPLSANGLSKLSDMAIAALAALCMNGKKQLD
jgi:hypothetical protein